MNESQSTRRLQIGAVSYLNSKPLVERLPELAAEADLLLDYPSHLADDLASGKLDVALIPSVEFARHAEYEMISDACVATRGEVMSVKLYSRVPMREIKTLALDAGSRTSAALVQILLKERCDVRPEMMPLPLGQSLAETSSDACLVIGDRAMHPPAESFVDVWDLGQEWTNWTGLPFVFAMWVARRGTSLGNLEQILNAARDEGVNCFDEIADRESVLLGIPRSTIDHYFQHSLYFTLGPREREGLILFYQKAYQLGLVPEGINRDFQHYTPVTKSD